MKKKSSESIKCWACRARESEERCIYCTPCRLAMAKGELRSLYGDRGCRICGKEMGKDDSISNVVCNKCISEI